MTLAALSVAPTSIHVGSIEQSKGCKGIFKQQALTCKMNETFSASKLSSESLRLVLSIQIYKYYESHCQQIIEFVAAPSLKKSFSSVITLQITFPEINSARRR